MSLPSLDHLTHNFVALCAAIVALILTAQLVVALILRATGPLLRIPWLARADAEVGEMFRRQVRRSARMGVALASLAMLAGMLLASLRRVRIVDLITDGIAQLLAGEPRFLTPRLLAVVAMVVAGAFVMESVASAFCAALGKGIALISWREERRQILSDAVLRLRTVLRVAIRFGAALFVADMLRLPDGAQRGLVITAYALLAFQGSRFVTQVAYVAVDALFDTSSKFTHMESPIKHLGRLQHLAGITKRVVDYFVYLGGATWVAEAITPGTWLAQVGRLGIRIIAIFYASRVLVELCISLVQDVFITGAGDDEPQTLQQRKTLVPVAMGFVRYGIYFCALILVLQEASIDPTPLLAGAGVLGVAIGFGAQTFVGDIVAGFFILFENLLLVGDRVEIGGVEGVVEEIGVRITRIRDDSGVLHAIPNGEVRKVANHSRSYVNAVIDVFVPYEEDLRRVRELLTTTVEKALAEHAGTPGSVAVDVEELTESGVRLQVIARVPPGQDEEMGGELRAVVVEALRAAKVGAPRPRQAVLIESKIRVGAPPKADAAEEEESGPPQPFSPQQGD
jgi:moderate conductance mechanosensitive channel